MWFVDWGCLWIAFACYTLLALWTFIEAVYAHNNMFQYCDM
jgi:hypothetical protein